MMNIQAPAVADPVGADAAPPSRRLSPLTALRFFAVAARTGRLCAPFSIDAETGCGYFLRWHESHAERPEVLHLGDMFSDALHHPA